MIQLNVAYHIKYSVLLICDIHGRICAQVTKVTFVLVQILY